MLHFPIHYRYILQFYRDGLDIFNEFSSLIFAWQYKMETTLKIRTEKREFYSVSLAFVYHGSLDKLSYNFLCCIYLCRMPVVELIIAHCNVEWIEKQTQYIQEQITIIDDSLLNTLHFSGCTQLSENEHIDTTQLNKCIKHFGIYRLSNNNNHRKTR